MSGRSFALILFLLVIGLAAYQMITSTMNDPAGMIQNVLTIGIVIGAFFLLFKLFSSSGSARSSYNRAAKQSKRKYAKSFTAPLKMQDAQKGKNGSVFKKKRKPSHLTVIEGKKGKKKDRASF
ncbi:SA1362 family protein [Ectobacillus antri]|uniref:SA1362 family protein n=1 Tax=Ectobacillus antri TaxID=2486280 RepID=A0ABT6H4I5_9BACI|nr:SA1362 family protein [Ectobacillus antri]MDG4655583.1 SA1362 family protein [Ectobacillus antri]MDG5753341.1 SA1362 family protein [Ectobacillus antri]